MELLISLVLTFIMLVLTTALFLAVIISFMSMIGLMKGDVPFVPIGKHVIEKVVALAPKEVGVFYDLGSGEGRVVVAMARAYPTMRAIGIERSFLPVFLTKLFRKRRPPNVSFLFKDFNEHSLSDASFVYTYLFTNVMHRLEQKFERELTPGARLVSCDFRLKIRQPNETHVVGHGGESHTLYVYDF